MANNAGKIIDKDLIPNNIKKGVNIYGVEGSLTGGSIQSYGGGNIEKLQDMRNSNIIGIGTYNNKIYVFYHNLWDSNYCKIFNMGWELEQTKKLGDIRQPMNIIGNTVYFSKNGGGVEINLDNFISKNISRYIVLPTKYNQYLGYWSFYGKASIVGLDAEYNLINGLEKHTDRSTFGMIKWEDYIIIITKGGVIKTKFISNTTWEYTEITQDLNQMGSYYIEGDLLIFLGISSLYNKIAINLKTHKKYRTYKDDMIRIDYVNKIGEDIIVGGRYNDEDVINKVYKWREIV